MLLTVLGLLALLFVVKGANGPRDRAVQLGTLALLILAFISPLCALATALFSARIFHHILLVVFVAPLLVIAFRPLVPAVRPGQEPPLFLPFFAHTVLIWIWHAPMPYAWALSGTLPYWIMEFTLLGSAVYLWWGLLAPGRNPVSIFAISLGTVMQMGFLGAIFTFAKSPLFAAHLSTTLPFGITPLEDQQLAGLVMWVPAALPYIALSLRMVPTLFPGDNGSAEDRQAENDTADNHRDKAASWFRG